MDVSAYLVHAATRQMAETEAVEKQFAGVDSLIAEAVGLSSPSTPGADELTEQERVEVEAALDLVYGRERPGARPGRAA